MFASKDLFLTRPSGYQISRSVRLRSSASAYFNRTPASTGSQTTWTMSLWVKRGVLGVRQFITMSGVNPNPSQVWQVEFDANNKLDFYNQTINTYRRTTQVFRDVGAWYHIVFGADTNNATAQNRFRCWVNGVEVTAWDVNSTISSGYSFAYNGAYLHGIGAYTYSGNGLPLDGYLTEVNFIDGQALTPSSFGETNAVTGVWQPKRYAGTYGTNGFYLNFSDNSGVTATTIGKDYSGNGNNWTPNNISVTAGVTYDSMLDVPTLYADGGNGRGNYPVWNVLKRYTANMGFSNANLTVTDAGTAATGATATMRTPASGKWYWEITATTISGVLGYISATTEANADGTAVGGNLGGYRSNGSITNLAGTAQTSGATYTSGDVIGLAVDVDNGTVQFYKNGTAQGATPSFTFTAGTILVPAVATDNSAGTKTFNANFGQRPFTYTPPTGFKALNTQNLPTPTISNGATVMAATLYTGTNANLTVTNTVSGVSMQPDLVWMKARSSAFSNTLTDSVRGVSKQVFSNLTNAETTESGKGLTAFNSNGFTLGPDLVTTGSTNANGTTYVAWQWQAGQGSTSSNTSGSITSTVSVNATAGFSVVTYTGTGANATVGHGLGVAPKMVIVKNRGQVDGWAVYHANQNASPASGYTALNETAAFATTAVPWNNTVPTSTVFSVGTSSRTNASAVNMVAYCFAAVAGYSAFGSYTGNGSTDGPFVYCGFRPRFILTKRTDGVGDWNLWDTSRSPYNQGGQTLWSNLSNAEYTAGIYYDVLSNGFKLKDGNADSNASGGTYIFMAVAENPFKLSLAR